MKSRRLFTFILSGLIILSFTACAGKTTVEEENVSETTTVLTETAETEVKESEPKVSEETETSSTEDIAVKNVEDTVSSLLSEYEGLKTETDTYAKYLDNADKMESFYETIRLTNYDLCVKMYEYSLDYAESVVNSDMSNDDKYDALEELYDGIYEDAGDEIYDSIYDGILEDMYDDFYDGLLSDAYDNEEYSEYEEWSDARSDEYEWWSDTRSEVYEDWSDMRSDIYEFYSDLRSSVWNDDIEKANEIIEDFREDTEKLKAGS